VSEAAPLDADRARIGRNHSRSVKTSRATASRPALEERSRTDRASAAEMLPVRTSQFKKTAPVKPETTRWQYTHGVADPSAVAPESYTLDSALLSRPGNDEIQLDLFGDYQSNVALYPAFQAYFRAHQPPLLAVWGKNDPFFLPPGAEAFRRDLPHAEVRFYDTGHFALETHASQIGGAIRDFLDRHLVPQHAAAK
jgi:pimeloyl-ACP methyl ester carboxylesterase